MYTIYPFPLSCFHGHSSIMMYDCLTIKFARHALETSHAKNTCYDNSQYKISNATCELLTSKIKKEYLKSCVRARKIYAKPTSFIDIQH